MTVRKNKVAPPFREAEFDIMYNEGISSAGDILDLGAESGIMDKRGAFFSYGDQRLGQGRENAKEFLRENPDIDARDREPAFARRRDCRHGGAFQPALRAGRWKPGLADGSGRIGPSGLV